jgi:predicted amidohydrolase
MAEENINPVTVACINFKLSGGDKTLALGKIKYLTLKAARQGANIILFPELALTGLPPDDAVSLFAEKIPGPSSEEIAALAAQMNIYVVFGMLEQDQNDSSIVYNSAVVIGPEGIIGRYRKVHPFAPFEKYTHGTEFPIFETPYGPIGVGICYDTYCFPEVCRSYAVRGVKLYLNPTAVPLGLECSDEAELCMTMLGARAVENQMFIASAGIVGKDTVEGLGETTFLGNSVILGPKPGYSSYHIYAGPASGTDEEIIISELDLTAVSTSPLVSNILGHRHPRQYSTLCKE